MSWTDDMRAVTGFDGSELELRVREAVVRHSRGDSWDDLGIPDLRALHELISQHGAQLKELGWDAYRTRMLRPLKEREPEPEPTRVYLPESLPSSPAPAPATAPAVPLYGEFRLTGRYHAQAEDVVARFLGKSIEELQAMSADEFTDHARKVHGQRRVVHTIGWL